NNTNNGDGCSSSCRSETGFACGGQPSVCVATCGNGVLDAGEDCDDGDTSSGDGCSASCENESGWLCSNPGVACTPFSVSIDSPAHGISSPAGSIVVSGHYTQLPPGQVMVTVNGAAATTVNQMMRTFSHTVTLNPSAVFNPIHVVVTNTANGDDVH